MFAKSTIYFYPSCLPLCSFKTKFPPQWIKDKLNWPVPFSSALLSLLLIMAVDSTRGVAASSNQECGNPLLQTLRLTKLIRTESVDLLRTYVSADIKLLYLILNPILTLWKACRLHFLLNMILTIIFLSAESLPRRTLRAFLQGLVERSPWPQHLRPGVLAEDSEHLYATPSLPPAFQMGVWAADRLAVAHEPAAGPAQHRPRPQQAIGCPREQLLPGPLPEPAFTRASWGAHDAASTQELLPAEVIRLYCPEDL